MVRHRHRRRRCSILSIAAGASVGALLFLAHATRSTPLSSPGSLSGGTWQPQIFSPPPELLLGPPPELLFSEAPARQESEADLSFARRLLPVRRPSPPQQYPDDDAVLLPDQEVLVLAAEPPVGDAKCVFQGGASSPARALGRLPGPGRQAYLCLMPDSDSGTPLLLPSSPARTTARILARRLLPSSPAPAPAPAHRAGANLIKWSNNSLVFDSALLDGGDVLVFAKGGRQGLNAAAGDIQCLYSSPASDGSIVASFPALASAQQLVRCPPPPSSLHFGRVTLALKGGEPLPSLATYGPSSLPVTPDNKNSFCACTMVRNVARFLSEWVHHHAAIGAEQFYLYDNGSDDDLAGQVTRLQAAGIRILTVTWPWTKTQEAGLSHSAATNQASCQWMAFIDIDEFIFSPRWNWPWTKTREAGLSHCAAMNQASCQWMVFIDIDEFIFSPQWKKLEYPSKSMLEALVFVDPQVGQVYLPCYDFGPSGHTSNPREGVCQGYICRINTVNRHKSLVRLDAVAYSLKNSVHHFELKSGFYKNWTTLAHVNHYKYQAWPEFKQKFERRVSAYVADWKDPMNLQSADRAPGLGVKAVEPDGWAQRFCECNDTDMKETSIKWFGVALGAADDIPLSPSPSPSIQ
ncbi:unnamed protein product [Alopecurus aequalis]